MPFMLLKKKLKRENELQALSIVTFFCQLDESNPYMNI